MNDVKPPAAWLELSLVATGLTAFMIAVMWVQRPPSGCALPPEQPRRLVLSRETDREHLAADLDTVTRIATRFTNATPDDGQRTRFLACAATLRQGVAERHSLTPSQVSAGVP